MSWIIKQLQDEVWQGASEHDVQKLLQIGTAYPYSFPSDQTFKECFQLWLDYLKLYHGKSDGNMEMAMKYAREDANARMQEGLKWAEAHQDEIKAIFERYK